MNSYTFLIGVMGCYQYMAYLQRDYLAISLRIGQLFDRLGGWGVYSNDPSRASLAWQTFCTTRYTTALRMLDTELATRGLDSTPTVSLTTELLVGPIDAQPVDKTFRPRRSTLAQAEPSLDQYVDPDAVPEDVAGLIEDAVAYGANLADNGVMTLRSGTVVGAE